MAKAQVQLDVHHDAALDYAKTAALASEGFGLPAGSFNPDRLRWLYERAFSSGTTVLGLYAGDRKVGQVALQHQDVQVEGGVARAIGLIDLFILKDFRSRTAIGSLYGEVERFCQQSGIRFIIGVPNEKAAPVNIRYLKLAPFLKLDIRAGLAKPWAMRRLIASRHVGNLGQAGTVDLVARYLPAGGTGLLWTPDRLWQRLNDPSVDYAVHASDRLLLVSTTRLTRRVSHTLLCGLFPRPGVIARPSDVAALTAAACLLHRRPAFLYVGRNDHVPLPGLPLPDRLRPSPMVVQCRDIQPGFEPVSFSRFEILDFDFA